MKKRFAAGILILLLSVPLSVSASADSWPSFGSAPAGVSYSQPVTGADGALALTLYDENGDGMPETALPAGLQIEAEAEPSTGLSRYYLRGLPTVAGDYSFVLLAQFPDGSSDLLHCSLRIDPAIPAVSSSPDVVCGTEDAATVSVAASVPDGGTLSYQWYVNTIPSVDGGMAVIGAVTPIYTVPVNEAGDYYYYCTVANNNNGAVAAASSPVIHVLVRGVTAIDVLSMPVVTQYHEGDALNILGLQIQATYSDGTTAIVSDPSALGIFPLMLNTAGEQDITVSYHGKICRFRVLVEASKDLVEVVHLPTRTTYEVGDTVDMTGLILKLTHRGIETLITEGFTWSPRIVTAEGTRPITVILSDGNSTTFNVSVSSAKKDQSIRIDTLPAKLVYKVGESLDTSGMVLSVVTNKDSRTVDSGYTCTPSRFTEATESQTVTVRYGSFTAVFTVRVEAEETVQPSPVPTPKVTVSPVSPSQTAVPARVTPSSAENTADRAPFLIVFIAVTIALAALAGAIIYLYMLRLRKKEKGSAEPGESETAYNADTPPAEPAEKDPEVSAKGKDPGAAHHDSVEPEKKDYFEGLFDDKEPK